MTHTIIAALLISNGSAFAFEPEAPKAEPAPLSGPKVVEKASASLVEMDMSGKLVRLDRQPAEVALTKVTLDEAGKKAADDVLKEHNKALDAFVQGNLIELAAVANATQSGDKAGALLLMSDLYKKHQALRDHALLPQRVAAAIGKEQGDKVLGMVRDYMTAVMKEEGAADKAAGKRETPGAYVVKENLRLLGIDLRASYERVIGQQTKDFDETLKSLNLSPAQESRVRAIVGDAFQASAASGGKYTPAEKTKVFWKVWAELDEAQRAALSERIKGSAKK